VVSVRGEVVGEVAAVGGWVSVAEVREGVRRGGCGFGGRPAGVLASLGRKSYPKGKHLTWLRCLPDTPKG
jgi:hypothetical protein